MTACILSTGGLSGNQTNKSGSAPTELYKMSFDSIVAKRERKWVGYLLSKGIQ